jgi:hypothetical protein
VSLCYAGPNNLALEPTPYSVRSCLTPASGRLTAGVRHRRSRSRGGSRWRRTYRDPVSRPGLRRIQSGVGQAAHGSPESREVAPATDPGAPDVYLVPGTWAPGILRTIFARGLPPPPGWTTVGSPFVEGARLSFPGSAVFRVIWGGRNLASDRSSGAAALCAAVKQDSKRLKFIISHSHGGGLALESLSAGASSPRSTWRSVIALSSGGRRAAYPRSRMGLSKACRACRELSGKVPRSASRSASLDRRRVRGRGRLLPHA